MLTLSLLAPAAPASAQSLQDAVRAVLPPPPWLRPSWVVASAAVLPTAWGAGSGASADAAGMLNRGGDAAGVAASRRASPRLIAGVALSVGAGALAWWSEEQADKAYRRYLHSAGRARQEDSLRRAQRYDRLAGAALLGMEAGLVYTTWVLLF